MVVNVIMDIDDTNIMKTEQICRTCLVDDGNFFDIAHTFDHVSIAQMIQDITNLQVNLPLF